MLDEADRMLDMGFIHDIKRVLALLPKRRQNLLYSATFTADIKALADTLLDNPAMIEVARRSAPAEAVRQKIHPVDRERKRELLSHLIKRNDWHQVLVFTRTKHGADRLAKQLNQDGVTALAIHGNKSQGARTRALAEFKSGDLRVLCATDIAARGIDIDQLPHVVNYDLSNVPEDYVHRIGRTGRAGASGEAISLVCVDEHAFLRDIEKLIRRDIPREIVPGFEPDPRAKAQPVFKQQGRGQQRQPARGHDQRAPRHTQGQHHGHGKPHARGNADAHGKAHAHKQHRHEHAAKQQPATAPAHKPAHAAPAAPSKPRTIYRFGGRPR